MSCNSTSCSPTPPVSLCDDPVLFRKTAESIAVASCYGILIPLTVVGNGLVIAACIINPKLRTPTNVFICGLAVSDVLVGVFSIPFWTFVSSHASITIGHCYPAYFFYISFDIFAGCASILQLTAIALERYIFTVFPLRHRRMSKCVYGWMLALAWTVATLMGALYRVQLVGQWQKEYSVVLFTCCFLCPLIVIISVYGYIFKIGRYHARSRRSSTTNVGSSGGFLKEFDLAVTALVITGVFVVAWLPFFLVTVIATFCLQCLPSQQGLSYLVKFVKLMQYAGSTVNPYIYAYRSGEMRRSFRKLLQMMLCMCGRKNEPRSPGENGPKAIWRSGSFKTDSVFRSASFRRKNTVADSSRATKKAGSQHKGKTEAPYIENASTKDFDKVAYL